jgi:sugar O-acyltransferase (sialic acid O-acetyltransferase NeuD family)
MDKINLILLGGGGHCHSVIESIEHAGKFNIAGILEPPPLKGEYISGYPVIGTDDEIPELVSRGYSFHVTVGHIKNPLPRRKLFELLKKHMAPIVTVIDPSAVVSERAQIGEGTVVLRQAFVNSGASIGYNCIINTGAIIEHDARIGHYVHVSTGAIVNGDCTIGDNCFIGSGAILSNNITICADVLIGAGAVVLRSVNEPGIYHGNPARLLK